MQPVVAVNSGHCPTCLARLALDPGDLVPRHFSAEQLRMGTMKTVCPGTGQSAKWVKVRPQYQKRVSK